MKAAELRALWTQSPRPAVVIKAAAGHDVCAQLRDRFEEAAPTQSWLAHRHRVTRATVDVPDVEALIRSQVSSITGTDNITVTSVQAIRFDAGDYILLEDDRPTQPSIEAILDFSAERSDRGQVAYCVSRQPYFVAPQEPGALSIVARRPDVARFVPYLTRTNPLPHPVYRLLARYSAL